MPPPTRGAKAADFDEAIQRVLDGEAPHQVASGFPFMNLAILKRLVAERKKTDTRLDEQRLALLRPDRGAERTPIRRCSGCSDLTAQNPCHRCHEPWQRKRMSA